MITFLVEDCQLDQYVFEKSVHLISKANCTDHLLLLEVIIVLFLYKRGKVLTTAGKKYSGTHK